ncbi:MAG: hypothetical protein DRH37_11855, partial [Deltaproteobacteria bacterium]
MGVSVTENINADVSDLNISTIDVVSIIENALVSLVSDTYYISVVDSVTASGSVGTTKIISINAFDGIVIVDGAEGFSLSPGV